MKRSVLVYALGVPALALLLFYLLIPTGKDPLALARWMYRVDPVLEAEFSRYRTVYDTAQAYASALEVADSRERAGSVSAGHRAGLVVRGDSGVSPALRAQVEGIARAELAALGVPEPRHPIGVVVMFDTRAFYPRFERAVVLPATPAGACTVVLRIGHRFQNFIGIGNSDRLLGTCGFFAVYGAPGAGMLRWLEATNMRRAAYLQRPESHGDGVVRDPGEANAAGRVPAVAACRAGRVQGCADLVAGREGTDEQFEYWVRRLPELVPPDPRVAIYSPTTLGSARNVVGYGLLSSLAQHLGPEGFGMVWRSADEPAAAYAAVAERPITDWVAEHLRTNIREYQAGPGLPVRQWAMALGLVALPFGLAVGLTRRRLG